MLLSLLVPSLTNSVYTSVNANIANISTTIDLPSQYGFPSRGYYITQASFDTIHDTTLDVMHAPAPPSWVESLHQLNYSLFTTLARQIDIYGGFTHLDAKNEDMSRRARRANKLYKHRREHDDDSANNPRHSFDRGHHQPNAKCKK